MPKTLEYYTGLPYTIQLEHDEEGWFVKVKELPGCMSDGETEEEARENIKDAMGMWLAVAIEDDMDIPEPMVNT